MFIDSGLANRTRALLLLRRDSSRRLSLALMLAFIYSPTFVTANSGDHVTGLSTHKCSRDNHLPSMESQIPSIYHNLSDLSLNHPNSKRIQLE